ncbi:uncharacterized protein (DUF1810 family) [Pedobacter sp. W3I1]|uniref:DUF1810 domain-containing protein n=1 Tax=Pedobacter sp. W3I1 TaxID=3042291 RepID=UPI002788534F|nr:DUF1810 domain-containing protein [Pedobacter sp. W3I1]MDQ0639957.1 uncharacterized protein (DUF1810 family) [Pedobacter sp. W3I1]
MESEKINRFLTAQNQAYLKALEEIRAGKKVSHWMWYIFPQLKGLGKSEISEYYALEGIHDATDYLKHPVLGRHLVEISNAVLSLTGRSAHEIFGSPDDMKLRSCMTLFARAKDADQVFKKVLDKYFDGQFDSLTLELLE